MEIEGKLVDLIHLKKDLKRQIILIENMIIMISFPQNHLVSIVSNMNYLDFHKSQTILCNVNLALYMVNFTSSYWHSLLLWVSKSAMHKTNYKRKAIWIIYRILPFNKWHKHAIIMFYKTSRTWNIKKQPHLI